MDEVEEVGPAPAKQTPILSPEKPSTPQSLIETPIDDRPISHCHTKQNVGPPKKWWLPGDPGPQLPDSEDEGEDKDKEEEEEQAYIGVGSKADPASYKEAVNNQHSAEWKEAMLEEHNWHLENGT